MRKSSEYWNLRDVSSMLSSNVSKMNQQQQETTEIPNRATEMGKPSHASVMRWKMCQCQTATTNVSNCTVNIPGSKHILQSTNDHIRRCRRCRHHHQHHNDNHHRHRHRHHNYCKPMTGFDTFNHIRWLDNVKWWLFVRCMVQSPALTPQKMFGKFCLEPQHEGTAEFCQSHSTRVVSIKDLGFIVGLLESKVEVHFWIPHKSTRKNRENSTTVDD